MSKCMKCGTNTSGFFASTFLYGKEYTDLWRNAGIECPDEVCKDCAEPFQLAYEKAKASERLAREIAISKIHVVTLSTLPIHAKYRIIDMVSFQSTLGTGFFSEFGSDISNIFGTEVNMMNEKMNTSVNKCKDAMRVLAYNIGANAVIGVDFDFSSNTRDATTVAAQGTAIYLENIEEVFMDKRNKP